MQWKTILKTLVDDSGRANFIAQQASTKDLVSSPETPVPQPAGPWYEEMVSFGDIL